MLSDPLLVVAKVAAALDRLGVRYVVGGSLASSLFGVPRSTQDVDVVAELREEHVAAFAEALASEFYVDAEMILDAVRRRSSFNVIHLATMFKADVFVPASDPWITSEMARGRVEQFPVGDALVPVRLASPEDTLLHKLVWYRLGDEVSDRQWGDLRGILKVRGGDLDAAYLTRWAEHLGVTELLQRALREAKSR